MIQVNPAQYLNPSLLYTTATTMSTSFTIDRLREKINSYVELLNQIRKEEDASSTADTKVLDILRPMIFTHWSSILRLAPEPEWKDVCVEIRRIDKKKDQTKNYLKILALRQQEEDDRRAAEALAAQMEAEDRKAAEALAAEMEEADRKAAQAFAAKVMDNPMDDDQVADLLLFQEDSDAESAASSSNKRSNEPSPPSPCVLRRRLTRNTRANMHAWVNDEEDDV